jgi:hypothetical protein
MKEIYKEIYKKVKEFDKIVLARHIGADPDALGSTLGFKELILNTFPEKKVSCVGVYSSVFKYMGKMDKLNEKFDTVIQGFNDLKLQSKSDDKELELRLKAIETELELQKETTKNNYTKLSIIIATITVIFAVLTFYFNFIH